MVLHNFTRKGSFFKLKPLSFFIHFWYNFHVPYSHLFYGIFIFNQIDNHTCLVCIYISILASMPSFMTFGKIVGCEDAPTPIPWQVSVQTGSFHFCGATILDSNTLLSAAHCFHPSSSPDGFSIRAGSTKTFSEGQVPT